jgi:DNA-binding response OmpR family regulator
MNPAKILIIDNNKKDKDFLYALLQGEGYRVSYSCSGYEGIKQAKQENFNLIITDLNLTDINGKNLISQLKKAAKNKGKNKASLLILSEQAEIEDIEEFFQQGIDDYIVKPPRLSCLLSKIEQWTSA